MSSNLNLHLGVKSDPIEYRFSWEWLLRILADEGVRFMQIGTFFEIYQLPDSAFLALREKAEQLGIVISSVFTAHRELGGFFRGDSAWNEVAFQNYQRLIRVGSLVGAESVGSNPGAVMRDQMDIKPAGIRTYLDSMKRLMHYAFQQGVRGLAIEPMSCLAEPPTLPSEIINMAEELVAYHRKYPTDTARVGYCFDISHGYVDENRNLQYSNHELLDAALPYITEIHLKNTNLVLDSTFGFAPHERARGIIDVERVRDHLLANAALLPVTDLIGYLEIGGPKLGRDYSDLELERQLRTSIRYLQETFVTPRAELPAHVTGASALRSEDSLLETSALSVPVVKIAPSMMCADMGRLRDEIQRLESLGADLLHWDIMDAHFVPNMPCGLAILEQMRNVTTLPFDVHLMVEDNDFFIAEFSKIGVQMISVHYESARHCDRTLSLIRDAGAAAGIALNPATPPAVLQYLTHLLDFLLVMTVNPGFAGQKLTGSGLAKIADCHSWMHNAGAKFLIEVDGNVSFEHIPKMVAAGADILVAGTSSLFNRAASKNENMRNIRAGIGAGLRIRDQHVAA
jgi:ribulose-phosphate 3-epimerase